MCSYYLNRGSEICSNCLSVERNALECQVMDFLRDRLYFKEAVAYLVERVHEAIQTRLKQRRDPGREHLQRELSEIDRQLANLERAILDGIFTETTARLLRDLETSRARVITAMEAQPLSVPTNLLSSLPSIVEAHLRDLPHTLSRDVVKAREMLRKLISEIRLIPIGLGEPWAYLEAEVVGNVSGLLSLQPALADTIGSGGRI